MGRRLEEERQRESRQREHCPHPLVRGLLVAWPAQPSSFLFQVYSRCILSAGLREFDRR